jgi:hypothetical protein
MNGHSPLPMQNALPASADRLYDMLLNVEKRLRRLENALMPSPMALPFMALPPGVQPNLQNVVQHLPAPQWRPISEAPKDGTNILGSSGGKIPFVMAWDDGEEIWVTFNCHYEYTVAKYGGKPWTPTHWMPLPAPPGKGAP